MPPPAGPASPWRRRALLAFAVALVGVVAAWAALRGAPSGPSLTSEERGYLRSRGPLRFAPDPAFPPLEWFDEQGAYRGLIADYFKLIEARLGASIEIVRARSWDEVLRLAEVHEVDGVTAAQATPKRSTYLTWTAPILDIPNVIIVRKEFSGEATLDALGRPAAEPGSGARSRRVAVTAGNALHEYVLARFPSVLLAPSADDLTCLQDVSFGRADAAVVNLATASYLIERHGIANLKVAGDSGRRNPLAIATRRDQPLLGSIMAKGLASVTPEEREEIYRRWIKLDLSPFAFGRQVAAALGGLLAVVAIVLGWNAVLRRRVASATAGLRAELAERKRAEAALAASQRKLTLHLEQTLFGVIEFDLEFRVAYWNPAAERIFGWTKEEALGRNAGELIVPRKFWPQVADVWASLLAQRGGQVHINENTTRDGRTIVCEWVNTPLTDGDGKVTGVMSLTIDVSERERVAQTLSRAQRLEALAVLAGGIAHDFNNLLTGILSNVSLARSDHPPAAELDELLEEAAAAAQRAATLTGQLLTFAKGGAPVKKVADLAPLVREAALFAARGATGACAFQFGQGLWPAEVDPGQIAQVVQNLVLNALEAMPAGGTVVVSLENTALQPGAQGGLAAGPYLRLRVSDLGVGIPAASLPRIFDPFFSTKDRGSGLGLAVCHSVVTRHGGSIEARSTPGSGTTFEVLLPAQPEAVSAGAKVEPATSRLRGRVLVMDDEEMVRRVTQRTLASLGCEVSVAADGADAVKQWQSARDQGRSFDLVLLDLTVAGGVGGVETLARLRALDPAVRAVVSSGYSNAPVIAEYQQYGFQAALSKPFTADEARAVVAGLLPEPPGE